ncbi:MAG TPA: OmpA family protein [Bacteroidales bacterium]|nr:OmpA family protein [Bacteroidales bacterium]
MKEFKLFWIFVLVFQSGSLLAQIDTRGLTANQLKNFGKNADRLGDTYSAVDFLEPYCKMRPRDAELNYRLAELYFASRDYQKAEKQFTKVYKEWSDRFPQALFYQAQSMKAQGKYPEAKEVFTKFQRKLKFVKDPNINSTIVREEIAGCDLAPTLIKAPLKIKIDPMNQSINSMHVELSPIPVNDNEIYYGSLRMDSVSRFTRDDTSKIPVRQLYEAHKEGNDWVGGQSLGEPINIPGVETGNGALSRDGKRFYFTRCAQNSFTGKMICQLYVANKTASGWDEPQKLNSLVNDPNYTSTQPTVGYAARSNLEIVYFASDRPGGRGGLDIWYTIYDKKKKDYLAPKNAGNKINSSANEMTPYYDLVTRTLYFSSNGRPGLGGYDVYKSLGELRKWYDVQNAGYPINTSYDDLYFTISPNREDGFMVSNRPGSNSLRNPSCCDDIFQYKWTDFIRLAVTGTVYPAEKGKIGKDLDQSQLMAMKETIKPLKGTVLALYMIDKKTKEKIFIDRDTTKEDGVYHFNLLPDKDYKFEMEGFQYFNEQVNLSTDGLNFSFTVEMPPIWVNILTDKPIVLKNVYYEFDKSELSQVAKNAIDTTLLELLNKADDIIVEVSAHTDSLGNYEYNKKLSQERAENVVNYLISKGVSKKRLVALGYGAERPVAPNFKPDGSDNPEGRDQNRRTEFRIIGTLSSLEDVDTEESTE